MKKIIWALMCASALFVSCSDDDKDEPQNNGQQTTNNDNGGGSTDKDKTTVDNCLEKLKAEYGIDVKLPANSKITRFSSLGCRWGVNVSSQTAKVDAQEVLSSIFNQTKTLSTAGVFLGDYDYDEETNKTVFKKEKEITDFAEALHTSMGSWEQYRWFFKTSEGYLVDILAQYDDEENYYNISIE